MTIGHNSRVIALGLASALSACSFRGGGNSSGDGDGEIDASVDAADGVDANPICDPIMLDLQLNGEPIDDPAAPVTVSVGDSINLNAGGSCSPTGNITFDWTFVAGDFVNRAQSTNQFFIEVYPDRPGDRSITVTIDDGASSPISQPLLFRVVGFGAVDVGQGSSVQVNEIALSNDRIWLATDSEALTQNINNIGVNNTYVTVNSDAANNTATIPTDVSDVAYDSDNDVVIFLSADGNDAYFFDRDMMVDDITSRSASATADGGSYVDAMHLANGGVRLITDIAAETSTDYAMFAKEWNRDLAGVISTQGNMLLAGGFALYRFVDMNTSDTLEIFNQGNNDDDGIAALFVDAGGQLWIGSDLGNADTGIGVIDDFDDNTVTEHLLGEVVRSIAQDAAGDMWVATDAGIRRFKADWNQWILLEAKHGLTDVDSNAVVIETIGAREEILVGTSTDLFRLRRP